MCNLFYLKTLSDLKMFYFGGSITNGTEVVATTHPPAVLTVLALEGWCVRWKAATVSWRGWLYMKMWWGQRWGHECGLWLCREKPEFPAADVEASRTDEGTPLSGRTWTGCNWSSYRRSRRGAWRWWAARRLQWEVVCATKAEENVKQVLWKG